MKNEKVERFIMLSKLVNKEMERLISTCEEIEKFGEDVEKGFDKGSTKEQQQELIDTISYNAELTDVLRRYL